MPVRKSTTSARSTRQPEYLPQQEVALWGMHVAGVQGMKWLEAESARLKYSAPLTMRTTIKRIREQLSTAASFRRPGRQKPKGVVTKGGSRLSKGADGLAGVIPYRRYHERRHSHTAMDR